MRLLILTLVAAATLSACGAGQPRRLATVAGVAVLTTEDRAVLDRRLDADGTFALLHPATTYAVRDGRLDIGVGAADGPDDDLRFLLSHQGRVLVTSEWGRVWLDRSGMADVQAARGDNGQPVLRFVLTPAGQQRFSKFATRDAAGSQMLLKLDDETLVSARLAGPIDGASFQVTLARPVAEVSLIAQLIRSGTLSFQPGQVSVRANPAS